MGGVSNDIPDASQMYYVSIYPFAQQNSQAPVVSYKKVLVHYEIPILVSKHQV